MYNDFLNEYSERFPDVPTSMLVDILADEYEIGRRAASMAVAEWVIGYTVEHLNDLEM